MKMKEIFIAAILVITVIASIALIVNATNTISYTLFGRMALYLSFRLSE